MPRKPETDLQATADLARNVTRLALESTAAQLAAGTHRDPAGAARNSAVVYGIAIDKLHALEDRPEVVDLTTDPRKEGLALLKKFGIEIPVTPQRVVAEIPETSVDRVLDRWDRTTN